MSGAVAAHAAYNGSGTQGLAVTNKINDTGDITSAFWTKHDTTRQLLHGCSLVEVVSSGSAGVANGFGSSRIFTVNNDVDVLGDLFLDLTLNLTPTIGGTSRTLLDYELDFNYQYKLIDRVEFMVGTQIWHTLYGTDIKVLTTTNKSESCNDVLSGQISSERFVDGTTLNTAVSADSQSFTRAPGTTQTETTRVLLWLPALSSNLAAPLNKFYNITENGYLMAAAPQQSVKIKITFASGLTPIVTNFATETGSVGTGEVAYPTGANGAREASGSIFNLINSNVATPSLLPLRRVVFGYSAAVPSGATNATPSISFSIGRSRLFAKQIMLCKEERDQIRSVPNGLPYRIKMSQSVRVDLPTSGVERTVDLDSFSLYASHLIISADIDGANIISAELKLNSSSFSGSIPALLLKNDMAESLHLYGGRFLINPHVQTSNVYVQNLGLYEHPTLIFPLASTAFSGSSVPLNRFDSIRLTLRFNTTPAATAAPVLTTMGITVTCVGETTVLYKGGAATLAMY
jgi:hypothetical protein